MDALSNRTVEGRKTVTVLFCDLVAQLNQHLDTRVGFLNPLLCEQLDRPVFNDVSKGTNGAYRARRGVWDACTGRGTPRGRALLEALSG